jgi:hypothetical protein
MKSGKELMEPPCASGGEIARFLYKDPHTLGNFLAHAFLFLRLTATAATGKFLSGIHPRARQAMYRGNAVYTRVPDGSSRRGTPR